MKSVTVTIGDYDLEVIEQIFENESKFAPNDPRDELMIEVMRQVKDNPKVDCFALSYLYAFDEWKNPTVVHQKTQIVKNDGCV